MTFDIKRAALLMQPELIEAQRRINVGEPFSTTAAELGMTPAELSEMLAEIQQEDAAWTR
jgi:hypothetical protein